MQKETQGIDNQTRYATIYGMPEQKTVKGLLQSPVSKPVSCSGSFSRKKEETNGNIKKCQNGTGKTLSYER